MSVKKFTPSKEQKIIPRLKEQRAKTIEFLGESTYQKAIATYLPELRRMMSERNCSAIAAACALLIETKSKDPLEKNLVACAGYDLALAS